MSREFSSLDYNTKNEVMSEQFCSLVKNSHTGNVRYSHRHSSAYNFNLVSLFPHNLIKSLYIDQED